jgi:hypothetical protein
LRRRLQGIFNRNFKQGMEMNKLKAITAGVLLALGATGAEASISDGQYPNVGELFVSIFDPSANGGLGRTYFRDLDVSLTDVLNAGSNWAFSVNLGADANYAGFAGKADLQYNIAAVYTLDEGGANIDQWGILATGSSFNGGFGNVLSTITNIQGYISKLNTALGDNVSGVVDNGLPQSWDDGNWGPLMGAAPSVFASTAGGVDLATLFFHVTNNTGDDSDGIVNQIAGRWLLSSNGTLEFGPAGSSPVPVPAAIYLLGSALAGLTLVSRRGQKA